MMNHPGGMIAARALAGVLALAAVGGGTSYAGSVIQKNSLVEAETAEDFAVLDAGVEAEDVSGMQSKLEKEDGRYVYDITFYAGGNKYEYEILAEDGTVVEKDVEQVSPTQAGGQRDESAAPSEESVTEESMSDSEEAGIREEDSQDTAVSDASQAPADREDGRDAGAASGGYISVDEAEEIALQDAGFTEEQVRFSTAKFEEDDDGDVYEIEFYVGSREYEYEIDARTGRILEYSEEDDDD